MSSTVESIGHVTRSRTRPSRGWYWIAVALVLLGVGCGVTWGVLSTLHAHDLAQALPRAGVPGEVALSVDAGASRLIFFEGSGKPSPQELGLTVTAPDGSSVAVQDYDLLMQYEIAGWAGTPVASFSAPASGTYTVTATASGREGRISAGDNFVRTQAIQVVGALALIFVSLIGGVVIAVVIAVQRSSKGEESRAS